MGVQALAGAQLGLWEKVAITVEGRLDGSMAELRLDEFGVSSLGDEKRRVGVAEVMEPDLPEACPGYCQI